MSFLMQSQRGYDQQNLSDQIQPNRIPPMSPPSFDEYSEQSFPSHPSPQLQSNNQLALLDHSNANLPKVGETRCYWALLSSDLHFIYTDPVLTSHLAEQADALIGKSLLVFVHPDEQASAKHDLGSVLESRTLHGSVTRVRFSRLLRVRRHLGYQGTGPLWSEAEKVLVDSNYMAVDIVINWAAEGLVLCFIHAVVDLTPDDNDELNKTGWTNWCGTTGMTVDQVQLLYRRLLVCIPQSGSMTRVFQILSNQQGRPLLLTWPPDNGNGQMPTGRDFAKLVADVQIGTGPQSGNEAKTSCTRRYKALQNMSAVVGEVESVFIPHGTVIFACHKFNSPHRPSTDAGSMQMGYSSNTYIPQTSHQQYYEHGNSYGLPTSSTSYNDYLSHQSQHVAQYSPGHYSQGSESSTSQQQYHSWNSPSPAHSTSPLPQAVSNLRSGSYPSPQQNQQWSAQSSSYIESDSAPSQGSPTFSYTAVEGNESGSSTAANDPVPPPRRRVSPGTTRDHGYGGRGAGNRPVGVLKCSSCKATQSPEWRKGPSGKKELCNACGLRYARSRAKKEGHTLTSQRRRKDKVAAAAVKRESATPPVSGSAAYPSLRRGGYDNSFSAGSNSGSEVYSQSSHHGLDTLTPSPSPPASSVNFVHYSPQSQSQAGENRQTYNNNSGSFYSVASPLSNPPVVNPQHGNPMSAYSDRLSPVTSTTAPASFERDREKDRELPPTPISAEPKQRKSAQTHERR